MGLKIHRVKKDGTIDPPILVPPGPMELAIYNDGDAPQTVNVGFYGFTCDNRKTKKELQELKNKIDKESEEE